MRVASSTALPVKNIDTKAALEASLSAFFLPAIVQRHCVHMLELKLYVILSDEKVYSK